MGTSGDQGALGGSEHMNMSCLPTNTGAGNGSICHQGIDETSATTSKAGLTSTMAGPMADQSQNHAGLPTGSDGLGVPAAAAEGERHETKEQLSRLLVSKQKELLRLQLRAKAQQLAQLRGRLHDSMLVQAGECAGASPPASTSYAGSAPLVPTANDEPGARGQVGQSGKTTYRKQEEIREQRDRLAAAVAKHRQLSGARVVLNSQVDRRSASSGQTRRFHASDAVTHGVSVDADGATPHISA